jgi:tRNA threonylcarbamoyladenosine biosynthesis protein TsaB
MRAAARTRRGTRILAIDTATWTCAVALVRDGRVLAERAERSQSSHAGTLPRLVEEVLAAAGERPEPGDAVAVSIGPGSFTGLRIALSFAKGLAFAGGLRLVGVPTLDALAVGALPWEGRLCAALDARKQEIYAALYERDGGIVRLGAPRAVAAARLAGELDGAWTFVGEAVGVYGEAFRAALGARAILLPPATHPPRASAVARLAAARLAGEPAGDDLVALAPVYVRPPEAELTQSARAPSSAVCATTTFVDKVPLVY